MFKSFKINFYDDVSGRFNNVMETRLVGISEKEGLEKIPMVSLDNYFQCVLRN